MMSVSQTVDKLMVADMPNPQIVIDQLINTVEGDIICLEAMYLNPVVKDFDLKATMPQVIQSLALFFKT